MPSESANAARARCLAIVHLPLTILSWDRTPDVSRNARTYRHLRLGSGVINTSETGQWISAQGLLGAADGVANEEIGRRRGVSANTVRAWRAAHWSTRTLAKRMGISHGAVANIWRDHELQPWKVDTFTLSTDPDLEAKLVDVV